jgi:Putative zinc-finger
VATGFSVQGQHPTSDVFEEYAFRRLSEADTDAVEEHVLVCPECQTSLAATDEYILLMKRALARLESFAPPTFANRSRRIQRIQTSAVAIAAIFLLCVGFMVMGARFGWPASPIALTTMPAESVPLMALRGGEDALLNRAGAGRPIDLHIDVTGLASADWYRVEIVNSRGQNTWDAELASSTGPLAAHVAKGFKRGQYWVRLYSSGRLQREFGLTVE